MDRYSKYARGLREIPNVESFSSRATILPLREFPRKCDPRRLRSYQKNQDIERSREDQPLLAISTEPYKLRRIVVPPIRSQYIEPSRIPNARDPRGLCACKKFNMRSKKLKYVPKWIPTLVENDQVLQEEETCAVLVIDVSEWVSRGIKRSYIEIIPHECNVQRSVVEVQRQLAELVGGAREDEMLMTPEEACEAERNMQTSARNAREQNNNSDIEECDSEVLPRAAPSAVFDTVEDRPMLELNDDDGPMDWSSNQKASRSGCTDEDEDEDMVTYEAAEPEEPPVPRLDDDNVECIEIDAGVPIKKEPQALPPQTPKSGDADVVCIDLDSDEGEPPPVAPKTEQQESPPPPPVPRFDDSDVECINLDSDEEESPIVPKKEAPQEVHVTFNKNLPPEVLDEITISDSEDDDWDLMRVAMQLSMGERETNKLKCDNNQPIGAVTLSPSDAQDSLDKSVGYRTGESIKEHGEDVSEASGNRSSDLCIQQMPEVPHNETGWCIQNRDCDHDPTIESDISDSVISKSRPAESHVMDGGKALESTEDSVGFCAEVPQTSDVADEAGRLSDSDSDMPTTMQLETLADVYEEPIRNEARDDVTTHSEMSQMQYENEAIVPVTANVAQKRKRIDSERLHADVNELHVLAAVVINTKRRKENNHDTAAVNDENQSDNCRALIERASSPVFMAPPRRRNKRMNKQPSKNVLQLSSTSTCAISKPIARNYQRTILFSNFSALGILNEYLKNYTTTYECINFFSKNYEKVLAFEFLRIDDYVKRNNDFWRNRYNHWHREENNVFIEGNQLTIEPMYPSMDNQAASVYEVPPREQKTVIEDGATVFQSEESCSTSKDVITVAENSWSVQGNNEEDDTGKMKSQRRHSLPIATTPQQSFGVKRLRSGSSDNHIKLTLRRSQADNNWFTTSNTSTMPKNSIQSRLSNSNNSTPNAIEQTSPNEPAVDSIANKACASVNKVLSKWSYVDKKVPELDLDDLANRPLPQKIQFDKSKLSLSLQCRVKRTNVDSAIASDYDDSSCKRMKLIDPTKDCKLQYNYYNNNDDELSLNENIGEPLEIIEIPTDSCREQSRLQSENVCNLNNNNNENTFKDSEKEMSFNFQILPKDCSSNTIVLEEKGFNLNKKNGPCMGNVNQDLLDDTSFASDGSIYLCMEDELDDPSNTAQSQDSNIQIDHNCNLQKQVDSLDEPCNKTLKTLQNEANLSEDLEKQSNLNNLYTKEVDRLNRNFEAFFGESNITEVKQMVAKKYNYMKYETDEWKDVQKDGESDNLMKTRLQSIEEKQPTANAVEQSCVKDVQLLAQNSTESVLMTSFTTNEKQQQIFNKDDAGMDVTLEKEAHNEISMSYEKDLTLDLALMTSITNGKQQQIFNEKDAATDATPEKEGHIEISMSYEKDLALESELMATITNNKEQQTILGTKDADTNAGLEKNDHIEISMSNKEELGLEISSSENEDRIITGQSSTTSDFQSNSPKTVDQREDGLDVQNSQALINKDKKIESNDTLESESDLCKDKQNSAILNEKVDSDVSYCNINDDTRSKQDFHDERDEHLLDCNVTDVERSSSKDEETLEYEKYPENGQNSSENQDKSDINASSSLSSQDHEHLEMTGLEEGLEEGDLDFHPSIHGFQNNSKYSNDDYDVDSDEEYEKQATLEHSKDISVQKSNESLVPNKNTDASDCLSNTLEKDSKSSTTKTEQVTISEDKYLHYSQKSTLKINNDNATKSKRNSMIDIDEKDEDINIDYEDINNDSNHLKDVKPNISTINNELNVLVSETVNLQVHDVVVTLESQTVQKVVSPALLPEQTLHHKDSMVESVHVQPETNTETMDLLNKSNVEIPVPDPGILSSSTLNNSSTSPSTMEVLVSSKSNDQVPSGRISENSMLAVEPNIQPSANVSIDFNNQNILEKFNLTREEVAPEDIKAENSVAFENNDEEQTLLNTLESMLKEDSGKECDTSEILNEENNSSVTVPSTFSSVNQVSLPIGLQSRHKSDLLKALNVNYVNDWDIIVDKTIDENSSKRESSKVVKVKNLNEKFKKVSHSSAENATSSPQAFLGNPLPNVPENIQENTNNGMEAFQEQSSLPVNMFFPINNSSPNAYIIQPPTLRYGYIVSQPYPVGVQPLMNMCNNLPAPMPIINNIRQQVHFPNTGVLSQVPMQNNVQIPAPAPAAAATSDKQAVVLASSIFPNMFDTRSTAYSSNTVHDLPTPPLANVILPPPYTILPFEDRSTILKKIRDYQSKLLDKLVETLRQLESMNINRIIEQLEVLIDRKTLTAETWKIQKKMLIIAQCVGAFKKLTTERNYSVIIEAIMGTIYRSVTDGNLLRKMFGYFQKLKKSGIFRSFSEEQHPLTLELGVELGQTATGMSSAQKEILKYQLRIDKEIQKIHHNQVQNNGDAHSNIKIHNQNLVSRSSSTALQQNIVTTTVSSPIPDIANISFQNTANIQNVQSVSTASIHETTKELHGNEKQNLSKQNTTHSKY